MILGFGSIVTATRDAHRTRNELLRAAQTLFAERGYTTTGVREVASAAGVNSTLIGRYFGSKEGLLRAAVDDLLQIDPFISGPRQEFGQRAMRTLLHGDQLPNPTAMMVLATADPAARVLCCDLMHERIVVPLATWLGGQDALQRAAKLNMLWIGFMTARHILPVPSLEEQVESTHEWLADLFQRIADGR
jgi:AcrR family transcriptional regulator